MHTLIDGILIPAFQGALSLGLMILFCAWISRYVVRQLRHAWREYADWMEEWRFWLLRKAQANDEFINLYREYTRMKSDQTKPEGMPETPEAPPKPQPTSSTIRPTQGKSTSYQSR